MTREYMSAYRDALHYQRMAAHALIDAPELVQHFVAFATGNLAYARALRTNDWSLTKIRPTWMLAMSRGMTDAR